MAKHALQPVHSNYNKMKLIIPIITAGALLSCTAAIAQADTGRISTPTSSVATQQNAASLDLEPVVASTPEVIAPIAAKLSYDRPVVTSIAAPKPVAAPVVEASKEATPAPAAATATPAAATTQAAVATTTTAATTASATDPANVPAASGASDGTADTLGARIAAAAKAQIGVEQDCTMLVTNSLKAVGINFHDWPAGYLSLGTVTTNPVPGDLIYYKDGGMGMAHIAVFIGDGKAVHGGWDGHSTKIGPVKLGSGPIYIHVTR